MQLIQLSNFTMKHLLPILSLLLIFTTSGRAQLRSVDTTMKSVTGRTSFSLKKGYDKPPEFPGGNIGLSRYISNNIKYPPVARLIGIDGRVIVTFAVDTNGKVVDVNPTKCVGAGCEAEAVSLLQQSPLWKPGQLDGKLIKVQYTVPLAFKMGDLDDKVRIAELRKTPYGFIFQINGEVYSLDKAEKIIGSTFKSGQVAEAVLYPPEGRYAVKDRKETYILVMQNIDTH
jgi:periplasmic protein TonB